jgi:hypothetical protein
MSSIRATGILENPFITIGYGFSLNLARMLQYLI